MSKIDIDGWKQFKIYELFHTEKIGKRIQTPTGASVKKAELIDGEIPRITVTNTNNGIAGFFNCKTNNSNYRVYENFISVSFLGTVFYQSSKASLDMKVHCLKLRDRELNRYVGQYLVTCIKKSLKESKYSDQISSKVLPQLDIRLPVDKIGEPDFAYMECYMKNLEIGVGTSLTKLMSTNRILNSIELDNVKWEEFVVGRIFPKIINPAVYHTREVESFNDGIPYIVRSKFNNGIKYRVMRPKNEVNPAHVISFGAENATFFYQKEEWVSGRDIYYIDVQEIDELACLFLVACLQQIATRYSYNYGLFPDLLKKEKIKLPVDEFGNPDYKYMSYFMKRINKLVCSKMNLINAI